jgi:hypothetical protein
MALTYRLVKGSALTYAELDGNFTHLQGEIDTFGRIFNALNYGVAADGVTDDSTALQNALTAATGAALYIPAGTYMCSGLTVSDDTKVYGDGAATVLKKNANGDVFSSVGARSTLHSFKIVGQGGIYTGRGAVVEDASPTITTDWWRRFDGLIIDRTESYCIEFVGSRSGYLSEIIGGTMTTYNGAVAAVKFPDSDTNGNRRMIGVMTFDTPIVHLGGCDNACIMGCEGKAPIYTSTTKKARVIGNRIASGAGIVLNGTQNVFTNNICADSTLELASGLYESEVSGNVFTGLTLIDNSPDGAGNWLDLPRQYYIPAWTTTPGTPDIGSGSYSASYLYAGDTVKVHIHLTIAANTNVGSGAFSLPFQANRAMVGSCYIQKASPVASYAGACFAVKDDTVLHICIGGTSDTWVGSAFPITWAAGDTMDLYFDMKTT